MTVHNTTSRWLQAVSACALLVHGSVAAQEEGAKAGGESAGTADEVAPEEEGGEESLGRPLADRIKAVSRKYFLKRRRFELAPGFGLSVNDPFFRSYMLQLDAAYHVAESLSVELRLGGSVYGQPLDPVEFLRREYSTLTNIVRPAYVAHLSATFTPMYGKVAVLSEWIWHYDLYLAGGLGVTGIGVLSGARLDVTGFRHQPSMNVGLGMRSFLNKWLVVRLEARDYVYPAVSEAMSLVQHLIVVSVGVGVYYPFTFEYEFDGYKVVS